MNGNGAFLGDLKNTDIRMLNIFDKLAIYQIFDQNSATNFKPSAQTPLSSYSDPNHHNEPNHPNELNEPNDQNALNHPNEANE